MSEAVQWQVAGGSVRGSRHRHAERNNQDAFCWSDADGTLVLVVTDGCSSAAHAEAGALAGSRMVARRARRAVAAHGVHEPRQFARAVRDGLVCDLEILLHAMGGSVDALAEYLLFTAVVAVATIDHTIVFALGDGVAALNGDVQVVTSAGNCPAYPAYAVRAQAPELTEPVVLWHSPTAEVCTLLVGTDGVTDLIAHAASPLPGRDEQLGPLSQFWTETRVFANADYVRRCLARANRETRRVDWSNRTAVAAPGLLPDDTTLVVARRRQGA